MRTKCGHPQIKEDEDSQEQAAGNSPETRKAMPGPEENAGQATERAGAQ